MMTFRDLTLLQEYRSPEKNIATEFYVPVLKLAVSYSRAVGFFSSSTLSSITEGVSALVKNGGKIKIVASPKLSEEDITAINLGYKKRNETIENALINSLNSATNFFEKERLNFLSNLIAKNILDIKIAIMENDGKIGMYHEKMGIMTDSDGNKIAFCGSMNETETAVALNYETIDVFCTWKSDESAMRAEQKQKAFDAIWKNREKKLCVLDFPKVKEEILNRYKLNDTIDFELDKKEFEIKMGNEGTAKNEFFSFAKNIVPRPHQQKAIDVFVKNNFQCLFAMATGTGKTLTSLFATNELSRHIELNSVLIIVPLKDLVDQWKKDVEKFFLGQIICVRSGIDWKSKVEEFALMKILLPKKSQKLTLITTYDSFCLNSEKILRCFDEKTSLIIADEVHKFGAENYRKKLPEIFKYRIGLSATPKRPYDDEGTKAIFDYFSAKECFEFTIKDAIEANMLCHYNYYPIVVTLTDDEMEKYDELSEKISRLSVIANNSKSKDDEDEKRLEQLLKERHRIIERAENKMDLFLEIMAEQIEKYKNGTIVFSPDGTDEDGNDLLSLYKQKLWEKMKEKSKIVVMSEYVQGTDKKIIDDFTDSRIDILFAKQRLNEGIDIPKANRAFFIASSTSEREFIQRRGRVLRLCEGKTIAEIFDFVVVPPCENLKNSDSIIKNEINRAFDFAKTADNYAEIEETLRAFL